MSTPLAVTVEEQAPFVVLDSADTIVGVGPDAISHFGPLVGSLLWDCFPGSQPLCKPYYDAARRKREPVEFVQFYDGYITRIRAVPRAEGRLELYWENISRLDTLTLASLADTLQKALELLDNRSADLDRDRVRKALRVIEGGA